MEDDDNIIPYETSPTLTVDQCVINMLNKRCNLSFMGEMKLIQNDLYDYVYELQDIPDTAHGNASYELYEPSHCINSGHRVIMRRTSGHPNSATTRISRRG